MALAIAGGVNLILDLAGTQMLVEGGMLSPAGRSRTFDERADGFARGEGVAAVLLKPLPQALADGDVIWGVIEASAVNNDGHAKAGLQAPSPQAQREVIARAYRQAGISAEAVGLIEAHGTGTALGDPIEWEGLAEAFSAFTPQRGFCALGSVKTNVGHLEAAAGMAGFIKGLLARCARQLPPTLHFDQPNRHLQLETSAFWINDRLRPGPPHSPKGPAAPASAPSASAAPMSTSSSENPPSPTRRVGQVPSGRSIWWRCRPNQPRHWGSWSPRIGIISIATRIPCCPIWRLRRESAAAPAAGGWRWSCTRRISWPTSCNC